MVIATASCLGPEITEVYEALFTRLGAAEVSSARPETSEDAHDPQLVQSLKDTTGIFMTGGSQLKLSRTICGTPFADAIVAAHERGAVVAVTSAGASIQSSHMVAFGVGGATPKQRMTQVAAGLGLLTSTVIDQHFDQRSRYGRLLRSCCRVRSSWGSGWTFACCDLIVQDPQEPHAGRSGGRVNVGLSAAWCRVVPRGAAWCLVARVHLGGFFEILPWWSPAPAIRAVG